MNKYILIVLSLCLAMVSGFAFAQDAIPGQAIADQILAFLDGISGPTYVIIGGAVEFILRLFKSQKPLSILYVIAGGFKMVGNLLAKVGNFLDKVLPQKTKE